MPEGRRGRCGRSGTGGGKPRIREADAYGVTSGGVGRVSSGRAHRDRQVQVGEQSRRRRRPRAFCQHLFRDRQGPGRCGFLIRLISPFGPCFSARVGNIPRTGASNVCHPASTPHPPTAHHATRPSTSCTDRETEPGEHSRSTVPVRRQLHGTHSRRAAP